MAIPKLRFNEFKDEWKKEYLKNSSYIITKGTTPLNFSESGIKFIKIECLKDNFIDNSKCLYIDEKTHTSTLKRSILEKNDILFAIAGATIGKCGIVKLENLPSNTNQALAIIRLKNTINPYFLLNILKSIRMQKYIFLNISIGAQPNINLEQMGNFMFSFPSIDEQSKIANFLSLLDKKIDLQKQKIEALKIYKIGLIQESYNNNCGNKIKMKDLIIQKSIRNAKNEVDNVYSVSNKEGFILQSEQFKDRTVASEDTQNYKIVEKNDFAYNPARINVGSIARMKQDVKGIISPMYICFRGNEKIIPEYLEYFFKSYKFTYEMNKRLEGSVRMCLSYESMINIPIELPCIEEQRKVSDLFNSIGHKINQEESKLKKLNEIKKGLLQKMFI